MPAGGRAVLCTTLGRGAATDLGTSGGMGPASGIRSSVGADVAGAPCSGLLVGDEPATILGGSNRLVLPEGTAVAVSILLCDFAKMPAGRQRPSWLKCCPVGQAEPQTCSLLPLTM